ncbi:MAG: hypothetical protein IPM42_06720 [Saprospiraceae bacterium]|nr:hypothetical protein [Saprospiraceae bacterium]
MKVLNVFALLILLATGMLISGCQKEELQNFHTSFKSVNNSIFQFQAYEIQANLGSNYNLHPYLYQVVEDIISNNIQSQISEKLGNIFWSDFYIYKDVINQKEVAYLPIGFYGLNKINALIVGVRDINSVENYNIQLIQRDEIKNYNAATRYIDEYNIGMFSFYDRTIYGNTQPCELCEYFDNMRLVNEIKTGLRNCSEFKLHLCFTRTCPSNTSGSGQTSSGGTSMGYWQNYGNNGWYIGFYNIGSTSNSSGGEGNGNGSNDDHKNGTTSNPKVQDCDMFKPKKKKLRDQTISGDRSDHVCEYCDDYIVNICTENENWWDAVWYITPCNNCNIVSDEDIFGTLESKCKENNNLQLMVKYKLKNVLTINELNSIVNNTECSCIGNNSYDECVLSALITTFTGTTSSCLNNINFDTKVLFLNWMKSHNNDAISTQVGNTLISEMCISGNSVSLNILEAKYIHETLKVTYPDYNNSNVNINQFIENYGVEKYLELANFYIQHQPITWLASLEIVDNWFYGTIEGSDYFYNSDYWENPNLTFPQQNLPSWNVFQNAYPTINGADNLYPIVGGAVYQAREDYPEVTQNTCALKVSIALNNSNVIIPNIPGETLVGLDGKYYFLNVLALKKWMEKTFKVYPETSKHKKFKLPEDSPLNGDKFNMKKGIYIMIPSNAVNFGAKGHSDIFNGLKCGYHCFFKDAKEINLWILE